MDLKEKLKLLSEKKKNHNELLNAKVAFMEQVDQLYNRVLDEWFCEYIDEGYIHYEYEQIVLFEEHIGEYKVNQLSLIVEEGPVIIFEPVGINIIGAHGRIDLYISGKKYDKFMLLLLQNENEEYYWELWKSNRKKDQYIFDESLFEKIIDNWLEDWILI